MIIVEGPDGSGKSTLCRTLKDGGFVERVLDSPRIAAKGDAERMKYETRRYLHLYGQNNRVAVDRFLFSEMVYGPVMRNKTAFTRGEYLVNLLEIMTTGSIAVFCLPDQYNFKENENPVAIERIEQLKKGYQACAEDSAFSNPKTYIHNWNAPGAMEKLLKFLRENQ